MKQNSSSSIARPSPTAFIKGTILGLTCAFIWSGWVLITSTGAKGQHFSIYDIAALRYAVAGLVFLPVLLKKGFSIGRGGWLGIAIMTIGAGPLYILLAAGGMSCMNICHVGGLLPGTMPLFTALLSILFLNEKMSQRRVLGLLLIIVGALTLMGFNPSTMDSSFVVNCVLLLSASFIWSAFTVAARYWKVHPVHRAALVSVYSALIYIPLYFIFWMEPTVIQVPLGEILLQLFYQGIMAAVLGLVFYSKSIELLGAARGAVFVAMVPVLATLMGIPLLGDWPTLTEWGAIAMLTFGVLNATGVRFKTSMKTA